MCKCSLLYRLHPREVKFLHDQRNERVMSIGNVDAAVTNQNVVRMQNRHQAAPASQINHIIIDNERMEEIFGEWSDGYESSDYECSDESDVDGEVDELVSDNVCRLTDRRYVSLRSTSDILNDAAINLGHSSECRSHMYVYRKKVERREKALEQKKNHY